MAVVIFHYNDGSKEILDQDHAVKFWDNILKVDDTISSADINFSVKTQFRIGAEDLETGIRDGSIRAYSIKFNDLNNNMFAPQVDSRYGNSFVLPVVREVYATPLRQTVELDVVGHKFDMPSGFFNKTSVVGTISANYKGYSHKNNFASTGSSNQASVDRFVHGGSIPKSNVVDSPVTPVTPVTPVEDSEKETLRQENKELRLEISNLKVTLEAMNANLTALTALVAASVATPAIPAVVVEEVAVIEEVKEISSEPTQADLDALVVKAEAELAELVAGYADPEDLMIARAAVNSAKYNAVPAEVKAASAAAAEAALVSGDYSSVFS